MFTFFCRMYVYITKIKIIRNVVVIRLKPAYKDTIETNSSIIAKASTQNNIVNLLVQKPTL